MANLPCARCGDSLEPIKVLDRTGRFDQNNINGLLWARADVAPTWSANNESSGLIQGWRCPRCFEVKLFAFSKTQVDEANAQFLGETEIAQEAQTVAEAERERKRQERSGWVSLSQGQGEVSLVDDEE